jgi:hypothetical protein
MYRIELSGFYGIYKLKKKIMIIYNKNAEFICFIGKMVDE